MAHYEIWLSDPYGSRLALVENYISMQLSRVNNGIGVVQITLPDSFDKTKAVKDGRIEIWRDAGRGLSLVTDTIFFARRFTRSMGGDGSKTFSIIGYSPFYILSNPSGSTGRIIDANAGSSNGKKSGSLDDVMKQIVRDNAGAAAAATRDLSAYLTVEANTSIGASVTKEFARRNVGACLKELHQQSFIDTPVIYYDFVSTRPGEIFFRTYPTLRGQDVSGTIIFSPERGNIASYTLDSDYTDEATAGYAGARGIKTARQTATSTSTRATDTPFNRREVFVNAAHFDTTTGLSGEAAAAVYAGRPQIRLEAELVDTPQARFGIDWNYGDKIGVAIDNLTFSAPIDAVGLSVAGGVEKINAYVRVTTA